MATKTKKAKQAKLGTTIGVNLVGKTVQLVQSFFKAGMKAEDHLFLCEGGFGCNPAAMGTAVCGKFLSDGEECRISRSQIAGIVK